MSKENIIRAWKDKDYRNSLNETERLQLPENPAGSIELTDDDLMNIDGSGGAQSRPPQCGIIRTRGCGFGF